MQKEFIQISCYAASSDAHMFVGIINEGIDAHLEAFTKSKFHYSNHGMADRLFMDFHISELPILVRRLEALDDESAESWASDIRDLPEYKEN